jgi:hypothetical protein
MNRSERQNDRSEDMRAAIEAAAFDLHVACPGIVQSFDPDAKTVTVKPAVRAAVDGKATELPILADVPVVFPSGGGFTLTFPVKPGDNCLVVFGDSCMDAWWQNGGIQDPVEFRQHDLSDAFAILAPLNQTHKVPNISAENVQLRHDDGDCYIEITPGKDVNIDTPGNASWHIGGTLQINAGGGGNGISFAGMIQVAGDVTADGISLNSHTHTCPHGGETSGPN